VHQNQSSSFLKNAAAFSANFARQDEYCLGKLVWFFSNLHAGAFGHTRWLDIKAASSASFARQEGLISLIRKGEEHT
jgi:hypothetical protein